MIPVLGQAETTIIAYCFSVISFSNNYASLEVYYEELSTFSVQQQEADSITNLICEYRGAGGSPGGATVHSQYSSRRLTVLLILYVSTRVQGGAWEGLGYILSAATGS